MRGGGADGILNIPREYFAPDASVHVSHQVAKFLQCKRTDQTMERCSLELDILRRKAEARVQMGAAFPDAFVSVL